MRKHVCRFLLGDDLTFVYLALTEENLVQRIEMRHPGREDIQEIIKVLKYHRNILYFSIPRVTVQCSNLWRRMRRVLSPSLLTALCKWTMLSVRYWSIVKSKNKRVLTSNNDIYLLPTNIKQQRRRTLRQSFKIIPVDFFVF